MFVTRKQLGYFFMILGLVLPLVILTKIAINQHQLSASFAEFRQTSRGFTTEESTWLENYESSRENNNSATTDPFLSPEGGVATPFGDKVVGYLKIAKIDLIEPIRIGASESHLNLGAAQVSGTGLPFGGNGNRSVLAGHRSWYGELRFFRVNELVVGDQIEVVLPHKTLVYEVYNQQVISANDWEQLLVKDNLDMLTLLTCEPVYPPFNYRLLVNAVRKPDAVKSSADYSNPRRTVSSVGTNEKVAESRFNGFYFIIGFGWVTVLYLLYRLYLARRDGK